MLKWIAQRLSYRLIDVDIDGTNHSLLLADSFLKRMIGLMHRSAPSGMLFRYSKPDRHSIWMVNMKFPIDVFWLDPDKKIIDSAWNLKPGSPDQHFPDQDALYVVELPCGIAKSLPKEILF